MQKCTFFRKTFFIFSRSQDFFSRFSKLFILFTKKTCIFARRLRSNNYLYNLKYLSCQYAKQIDHAEAVHFCAEKNVTISQTMIFFIFQNYGVNVW